MQQGRQRSASEPRRHHRVRWRGLSRPCGVALAGFTVATALTLSGCSESPKLLTQSLGAAVGASAHPEPPVEIYSRVAGGALKCWFGAQGSLKKTHIFHADAAPPSAGGEAEIVIHERDTTAQSPRSLRYYRINIQRSGDGSTVKIENLRFPEAVAKDMAGDVFRWAGGNADCSVVGIGGWGAKPGNAIEASAAAPAPKKKASSRK